MPRVPLWLSQFGEERGHGRICPWSQWWFGPWGQSGFEAKILALALASQIWPRPQPRSFGLHLKHLAWAYPRSRCLIGQNTTKLMSNSEILLIFPAIILNCMLLIIIWCFFHNYFWPRSWMNEWMTKTCNARSCRTSRIWGAGSRRAGQRWLVVRCGWLEMWDEFLVGV